MKPSRKTRERGGPPPPAPFRLDPLLEAESFPVLDLGLSALRLMDDARYPWLLLVPRVPEAVEVLDLAIPDQLRLWDEIRLCSHVLREETGAHKLNIAQLGNQVSQLHVHLVARFPHDDAWPSPVWGVHPRQAYEPAAARALAESLARAVRG
jgi:diadenosine tetraphosphate (Ap4A) HIT family hydrolase